MKSFRKAIRKGIIICLVVSLLCSIGLNYYFYVETNYQNEIVNNNTEQIAFLKSTNNQLETENSRLKTNISKQVMKDFGSVEELQEWLAKDNTNELQLPICTAYALMLTRRAGEDYYYIYYDSGFVGELNNLSTYQKMPWHSRMILDNNKFERKRQ